MSIDKILNLKPGDIVTTSYPYMGWKKIYQAEVVEIISGACCESGYLIAVKSDKWFGNTLHLDSAWINDSV